jgi:chromosome segregation ATPase
VREFWLSLVPYFEQLDRCEELRNAITGLRQRMDVLDQTSTSLRSEVEKERNQAQRYFHTLKDKDQEIAELRMALRRVEDENEWERQRHHTVLAHLRASVCFVPVKSTFSVFP